MRETVGEARARIDAGLRRKAELTEARRAARPAPVSREALLDELERLIYAARPVLMECRPDAIERACALVRRAKGECNG